MPVPARTPTDVSTLADAQLFNAEDGLHKMYAVCKDARASTADIEDAFSALTMEMAHRQLMWSPLDVSIARGDFTKAVSDDTVEQRQGGADAGLALPDGSFYIPDEAHLHQAIRLVAQAPDPQAAMNHIIERAQAMGLESALPPAWLAATLAGQPQAPQVGPGAHSLPGAPPTGAGGKPSTPGGAGAGGAAAGGKPPANAPGAMPTPAPTKPNILKRLGDAMAKAMGGSFDADAFEAALDLTLDPEFEYAVITKSAEQRFTNGPVYMPGILDAHGEWATAEDLQKSLHEYVRETGSDRSIYLQHSPKRAGEWVELMAWPQEVVATMQKSVDGITKSESTTFPAGTVYMGVVWEPWAYEDVKKGRITGFSMGGYARRVEADVHA